MAWRKKSDVSDVEEIQEEQVEPQVETQPEPERVTKMQELPALKVAVEAAQRFLEHAETMKSVLSNGAPLGSIKKSPDMRRLKRASLDLTSELVILRKELP